MIIALAAYRWGDFFIKKGGMYKTNAKKTGIRQGIFPLRSAYNRGMKKTFLAISMAVAVLFSAAVGLCFRALDAPQSVFSQADAGMKIVLDAGHGGIDGGVNGVTTNVKESDINLAIVMVMKDELEDMGFDVTLTRKTEAGLYDTTAKGFKKRDMQRRKEIIEETKPALVVSVHQNYYPAQSSRGAQVFYSAKNEKSKRLATALQEKLNALYAGEGVKGRKISAGEYFMLECTPYPSVIVECGFFSSPADERLLTSEAWQKRLAEEVAAGVVEYLFDGAV